MLFSTDFISVLLKSLNNNKKKIEHFKNYACVIAPCHGNCSYLIYASLDIPLGLSTVRLSTIVDA